MRAGTTERRIGCPWCAEFIELVIDLSAGSQSYIEDCTVCCQPIEVTFETDGEELHELTIDRA